MKSKYNIWLTPPHLGDNELNYISEAVKSNWLTSSGYFVDEFEAFLENYLQKDSFVTALNSGTSAIHLALIELNVTSEDEVLCQSFTFCGSVNPILYLGAKPVFIGSEALTYNMCPIALEEAINNRLKTGIKPKAIIIVHLYGMPANMDELTKISFKYKIPIIEDAAEAIGSSYKNKKCGTLGDYGVLSFNGNKLITTSGGGALITKSLKSKENIIHLASQAKDVAPHYEHTKIGYNYRLSNLLAAVGLAQLENLELRLTQLKQNHEFYINLFKESATISLQNSPSKDYNSNHWLNCISIKDNASFTKETIVNHLEKQNIESRPFWKPMHIQPVFKSFLYFGTNLEVKLFKSGLCLPSGSNLTSADRKEIALALRPFI